MKKGIQRRLMRLYFRFVQPALVFLKHGRRRRLWPPPYPTLELNLHPEETTGPACRDIVARTARRMDFYALNRPGPCGSRFRLTPTMVRLDTWPDGQEVRPWLRKRSRATIAKLNKTERMGYTVRPFAEANYLHDLHEVRQSKPFRSGGPMLTRWMAAPPGETATPASARPVSPPSCPWHWTVWWGCFLPCPGHRNGRLTTDDRLVAFIKVIRCGEVAQYREILGHADHLRDGVMPLLHCRILECLRAAERPEWRGVRAIWYGGLEHGGPSLVDWKRHMGFAPVHARLVDSAGVPVA